MPRFFLPPESWNEAALTGDEARHASQVLRLQPGHEITVFDGKGRRALAGILRVSRDRVDLRLGEHRPSPAAGAPITLVQAIPKGKNMDLVVQKAVELGVSAIIPVITRNTVVQPGEGKAEKWRRTALEACKQCGQDTLPEISDPLPFPQSLAALRSSPGLKIIASLAEGALPIKQILRAAPPATAATLLVGPEGDFTPAETASALDAGFQPVTLGRIVLRVETATLFCLSALRYEFG